MNISGAQPGDSLTFILFDPAAPRELKRHAVPAERLPRQKKRHVTKEEKANIKVVKSKGACLRCKILKKQCDDEQPCKKCPVQSLESPGDHWRVLGCYRGELAGVVDDLVPGWLEQNSRTVFLPSGETLNLHLASDVTADSIVDMVHFQGPRGLLLGTSFYHKYHAPYRDDKSRTIKTCIDALHGTGRDAASELGLLEDIANIYRMRPTYDPIKLLEKIQSEQDRAFNLRSPNSILGELSKRIIIGACAINQRESQLLLAVEYASRICTTGLTDVFADVATYSTPHLNEDLKQCVEVFGKICSKRQSIKPSEWPSAFYFLLSMSIVKSILINTCHTYHDGHNISLLQSTYSVLVSIFHWAIGPNDPLLVGYPGLDATSVISASLQEIQQLVKIEHWEEWKIKSTKDFLLGLGQYGSSNTRLPFNGFVCQVEQFETHHEKLWRPPNGVRDAGLMTGSSWKVLPISLVEGVLDLPAKGYGDNTRTGLSKKVPSHLNGGQEVAREDTTEGALHFKYSSHIVVTESSLSDHIEIENPENLPSRTAMRITAEETTARSLSTTLLSNNQAAYDERQSPGHSMATLVLESQVDGMEVSKELRTGPWSPLGDVGPPYIENKTIDRQVSSLKSAMSSFRDSLKNCGSPMSISSWMKEDDIMTFSLSSRRSISTSSQSGTSVQKVEAKFLRDFRCCDQHFPTFHDLEEHRERSHVRIRPKPPASVLEEAAKSYEGPSEQLHSETAGLESPETSFSSSFHLAYSNSDHTINTADYMEDDVEL